MGVTVDTKGSAALRVNIYSDMLADKILWQRTYHLFNIQNPLSPFSNFFIECGENFFGRNCNSSCNATCKSCNRSTGVCDTGCLPGWRGAFCHKGSSSVYNRCLMCIWSYNTFSVKEKNLSHMQVKISFQCLCFYHFSLHYSNYHYQYIFVHVSSRKFSSW